MQSSSSSAGAGAALLLIILIPILAAWVVVIAGMWKMFVKAGRGGWEAIIPFLNTDGLCKIAGRPGWWLLLFFIPFVNFVVLIIVLIDLARAFGKGTGFGVLTAFFPFIGFCILGFGQARYLGPQVTPRAVPAYAPPPPPAG
jgi:hypothetical protein